MIQIFLHSFIIHAAPGLMLLVITLWFYLLNKTPNPGPLTNETTRAMIRGAIQDNLYKSKGGDAT